MVSKTSLAPAHRPLPTGILALFFVLTVVRFGLRLSPWFPTTFPGMEEQTDILHYEQNDLENLLTPFGKSSAIEFGVGPEMDDTMCWESEFPGAEAARAAHEERLLGIEARKQARKQHRSEKHNLAQATKHGFAKYFQERQEAKAQRRQDISWSNLLLGGKQAQFLHDDMMHKLEVRKQMRKRSRLEKHALAQAWMQNLPGSNQAELEHEQRLRDFASRKEERRQNRLRRRLFAQKAKDGFLQYFLARSNARLELRSNRSWMENLYGLKQAQLEHKQRMQDLEARKQTRQTKRLEMRDFAEATKDSFMKYFENRKEVRAQLRKERKWAQGLLGAQQAQFQHQERMVDAYVRKQARKESRSEKKAFALETKAAFAQYFQDRKCGRAHHNDRNWAQGLPGAQEAQFRHHQTMRSFETRQLARDQARRMTQSK